MGTLGAWQLDLEVGTCLRLSHWKPACLAQSQGESSSPSPEVLLVDMRVLLGWPGPSESPSDFRGAGEGHSEQTWAGSTGYLAQLFIRGRGKAKKNPEGGCTESVCIKLKGS